MDGDAAAWPPNRFRASSCFFLSSFESELFRACGRFWGAGRASFVWVRSLRFFWRTWFAFAANGLNGSSGFLRRSRILNPPIIESHCRLVKNNPLIMPNSSSLLCHRFSCIDQYHWIQTESCGQS